MAIGFKRFEEVIAEVEGFISPQEYREQQILLLELEQRVDQLEEILKSSLEEVVLVNRSGSLRLPMMVSGLNPSEPHEGISVSGYVDGQRYTLERNPLLHDEDVQV